MSAKRDELIALITRMSGQANILTIPRVLLDLLDGDHVAALFLSQCVYWSDKTRKSDGSFYKSADEWRDELSISYAQVERVRSRLTTLGLVEHYVKKEAGRPVSHYRVDHVALADAVRALLAQALSDDESDDGKTQDDAQQDALPIIDKVESRKSAKSDSRQSRKSDSRQSRESYTETTQETTQETSVKRELTPTQALIADFFKARGYAASNYAREAAAATRLLKAHSADDVLKCGAYLETRKYYSERALSLSHVESEIGAWVKNGRKVASAPVGGTTRKQDAQRVKAARLDNHWDARRIESIDEQLKSDETSADMRAKLASERARLVNNIAQRNVKETA